MIYDNSSSDPSKYECPNCHVVGNFKFHGSYKRFLRKIRKTTMINISRYRCCSCMSTHSVIPKNVIPYKQYSVYLAYAICLDWLSGMPARKIRRKYLIPESTRRRYIKCGIAFFSFMYKTLPKRELLMLKIFSNPLSKDNFLKLCIEKLSRKFCENKRLNNPIVSEKLNSFAFT